MGVFDLASPILSWVDGGLDNVLPPAGRLVAWAVAGSVVSMVLYIQLSPQRRIASLKTETTAVRAIISRYDGDFAGLWPLIGRSLGMSLGQMGLMLGPALVASLPILFLVVWLSNTYGYNPPQPDAPVQVTIEPRGAALRFSPEIAVPTASNAWVLRWPAPGESITLLDEAGEVLTVLPSAAPVPVVHKRHWWNLLVGNPGGYLPQATAVETVSIDLPKADYLGLGPKWVRSWEVPFFVVMIVASIGIKLGWRIQ